MVLLAEAQAAGLEKASVHGMLFRLQVHPELAGLVQICRNLKEIFHAAVELPGFPLDALGMRAWVPVLDWILDHRDPLAEKLFATSKSSKFRDRFLLAGSNSSFRYWATHQGLCCLLWASPPEHADQKLWQHFRLFQAHVLQAHVSILEHLGQHGIWNLREELYASFQESLYDATLAAWKFLTPRWRSVLVKLPVQLSSSEFSEWCHKRENQEIITDALTADDPANTSSYTFPPERVSAALGSVAGFLRWGLDPEKHRNQNRHGHGFGGGSHDWEDSTENDGVVTLKIGCGSEDGMHDHAGDLHQTFHRISDPRTRDQLLGADTAPDEYLLTRSVSLAQDAAAAAMGNGGWAERANQLLPWSYSLLSSAELARVLQQLARYHEPGELELSALLHTMLWTGSSLEQATALTVCLDDAPAPDCDLSLHIRRSACFGAQNTAVWRVRALPLRYQTIQRSVAGKDRQRREMFDLPDVVAAIVPIQAWLTHLREVVKEPLAQTESMRQMGFKLFSNDNYETRLRSLLRRIDPSGRTVPQKIGKALFQHILERTGGDLASAALLTRTNHYLASVRRFYATPAISHLQGIYCDATRSLAQELRLGGHSAQSAAPTVGNQGNHPSAVGSRLCPTRNAVKRAVRLLKLQIRKPSQPEADGNSRVGFIRRHNWYTLYCVWSFSLAAGMRGIHSPYLRSSAIDPNSGFASLTDKDSGSGYHRRLIWLPNGIRKQIQLYEVYLASLRRLGLPGATRKRPCYFLSDSGQPDDVRPATIVHQTSQFFPFPANFARRFVRTELLEDGVPPEVMDAWMGHWWQGEEPWGPYSTFSYSQYRQTLESKLVPFLDDLGIRPISLEAR